MTRLLIPTALILAVSTACPSGVGPVSNHDDAVGEGPRLGWSWSEELSESHPGCAVTASLSLRNGGTRRSSRRT